MKKVTIVFLSLILLSISSYAQNKGDVKLKVRRDGSYLIDTRVDNMRYWKMLAAKGLVPVAGESKAPLGVYSTSKIKAFSVLTDESVDVPVTEGSTSTQTENSVFISPVNTSFVINSNNSTENPVGALYGANYFFSEDQGVIWGGTTAGAGGENSGDPATAIGLDGRMYIGFIHSNSGQGVSYSVNGTTWTSKIAGLSDGAGGMLDKNHLWIDNSPTSPYEGNVYDAWSPLGGTTANENNIEIVRTTDGGLTYSAPINLSSAIAAGSHNQGVNLNTGPNGEVYACWAVYDSWPSPETCIGFAKSLNGGTSYSPGTRIISNIKGIRQDYGSFAKDMRVNSFPVMAVDISGGDHNGNIYIVWANYGVPGTNTGTNVSVYMIKSTDQGTTWSTPIRVNQGSNAAGKTSFMPWITCDPETGTLSVIFYDDRNVTSAQCEAWVANSYDGGTTWEDFKISDVSFTPTPIPGLAGGYMGDYIGISARGGLVYPVWADNRSGSCMTYCSPFLTNNRPRPSALNIALTEETGKIDLTWAYTGVKKAFQHFVVYRNNVQIGTTTDLFYTDYLPSYGTFSYSITAMHDDGESGSIKGNTTWGQSLMSVNPLSLTQDLETNQTAVQQLTIVNNGQLPLIYNLATSITSKAKNRAYCAASASTNDEFISNVTFGTINKTSTWTTYSDFTAESTTISAGTDYPITITNGNPYSGDKCGVWIDWNQDEDFEDAGESITLTNSTGNGPYTGIITPPSDAVSGNTRMRVRIAYNSVPAPCGSTNYGEVEDYTVNVISWLGSDNKTGTINPGNSQVVNVTFNSNLLADGIYSANLTFTGNSVSNPTIIVPVTLNVLTNVPLSSVPTSDLNNVCPSTVVQLHANATGGSGTNTYAWTSVPAGFTSTDANPTVTPLQTTVYSVEINDGTTTITSQITINVIESLEIPATPTGSTYVGNGGPNTIYTTTGSLYTTSYVWEVLPATAGTIAGTGLTGIVDWTPGYVGTATIKVKAVNSCVESLYSDLLNVTVINSTSKIDNVSEINYRVYPNPNNGKFNIELNSVKAENITVEVYNLQGMLIYSKKISSNSSKNITQIDLGTSTKGVYFVKINGSNKKLVTKIYVD